MEPHVTGFWSKKENRPEKYNDCIRFEHQLQSWFVQEAFYSRLIRIVHETVESRQEFLNLRSLRKGKKRLS